MDALVMAGQLILSLAILVTLHEMGHFLAARAFGIKVEKFYLFFDAGGFKLFSFKKGDTEYGIGWLPLGGYVKIAGMIDESLDTDQLAKEPEPWEFRAKPAWQRLIVMLGGVTVNAILGIIIFTFLVYGYGKEYLPVENMKYGIAVGEFGERLGFMEGDKLVAVNDIPVVKFKDAVNPNTYLIDNSVYTVERNGAKKNITLPKGFIDSMAGNKGQFIMPKQKVKVDRVTQNAYGKQAPLKKGDIILTVNDSLNPFIHTIKEELKKVKDQDVKLTVLRDGKEETLTANVDSNASIGFAFSSGDLKTETTYFSFGASWGEGYTMAKENLLLNVKFFGKVFSGKADASKSLSGPIGIAEQFGGDWDWQNFWTLTGLLSVILAFMNLLPIPALDGGHVVFLLYEMITGKPLPEKFLHVMQVIGMVILLALMVFIFGNDIYKIIQRFI